MNKNTPLVTVAKSVLAAILLVVLSQSAIAAEGEGTLTTTEIKPVLFSDDHTSEGYVTYSLDGGSWDNCQLITRNRDYALTEIAGAWCGNKRIVALIRDDKRERGHPLLQIESLDNGKTWTEPEPGSG